LFSEWSEASDTPGIAKPLIPDNYSPCTVAANASQLERIRGG